MGASRRPIYERYLDPESWLGKIILGQVTDNSSRVVGSSNCKRFKAEEVPKDLSFGGYSEAELKKMKLL